MGDISFDDIANCIFIGIGDVERADALGCARGGEKGGLDPAWDRKEQHEEQHHQKKTAGKKAA